MIFHAPSFSCSAVRVTTSLVVSGLRTENRTEHFVPGQRSNPFPFLFLATLHKPDHHRKQRHHDQNFYHQLGWKRHPLASYNLLYCFQLGIDQLRPFRHFFISSAARNATGLAWSLQQGTNCRFPSWLGSKAAFSCASIAPRQRLQFRNHSCSSLELRTSLSSPLSSPIYKHSDQRLFGLRF